VIGSFTTHRLSIKETGFLLDGEPFLLQGLSFFNAIYNPAFNESPQARLDWLNRFKEYGINALRVWCQWDFNPSTHAFADVHPDHTMYTPAGEVRREHLDTLIAIVEAADGLGMVIEVTLFSNEKQPNLPILAQELAAVRMAQELSPYRNLILQIWNENSTETRRYYEAIKKVDLLRITTNSPGRDLNFLGDDAHNSLLDILTPHTNRSRVLGYPNPRNTGDNVVPFYEQAPREIEYFLEKYKKPVVDDEPARTGTVKHGGIPTSRPEQHVLHVERVRAIGGYHVYHHDMFQTGYGTPAVPPSGIPDPQFSDFHRQVFEYLRANQRW
jgi:hypothetical protein